MSESENALKVLGKERTIEGVTRLRSFFFFLRELGIKGISL